MVNLNIIVEGGTFDSNSGEETFNNVEALRESLNKLFSRLLNRDDISIRVDLGAGNRNSAKMFIKPKSVIRPTFQSIYFFQVCL